MGIMSNLKHNWNVFSAPRRYSEDDRGCSTSYNPNTPRYTRGNERTIMTSICNRIAIDVSSISIRHVKLDDKDRFSDVIKSPLNNCLSVEANIDQTHIAFMLDLAASMLDEGCVAVIPTDIDIAPTETGAFDILALRTGKIVDWRPKYIDVSIYNEATGNRETLTVPKSKVAIIENPLYAVMNEPNSTMQRLKRKLSLLDTVDEESSSGSLNLLVQLPYAIKGESKKAKAETRRKDIEEQLSSNKYGVAYIDGAEKVTQLNRPIDNNLMKQIEYLTVQLQAQLGITQSILDGTADEQTLTNYYNRTVVPIISEIVAEFYRKFLSKTAREQNESIHYFRDPFKLIPISQIADISDSFTRNEIISSNEVRQAIGYKPSTDPSADELRNKNISQSNDAITAKQGIDIQNEQKEDKNE